MKSNRQHHMEPRPLTTGDILDESVDLVWSRFWLFWGAVLFIEGPPMLIVNALLGLTRHIGKIRPELEAGCVISAVIQILFLMLSFMCTRAFFAEAVSKTLRGRRLVFSELMFTVLKKAGSLTVHAIISVAGLSFFTLILLISAEITTKPSGSGKAMIVAVIMLIAAVSAFSVRFSLSLPLLFLESRSGVIQCFRRSWTLTGGSFWRTSVLWILTRGILLVPAFAAVQVTHYSVSIIAVFLFLPFAAFTETLEACDLKIRKDAWDIWLSIERCEEKLREGPELQ